MITARISAQAALLKLRIKLTMAAEPINQSIKAINHLYFVSWRNITQQSIQEVCKKGGLEK